MTIRWIGALCIVIGSGLVGLTYTYNHKRTLSILKQFISALAFMDQELRYRHASVPELLESTSQHASGIIAELLKHLKIEIDLNTQPDIRACMENAVHKVRDIPEVIQYACRLLGESLGLFDISGQLDNLNSVRLECLALQKQLSEDQIQRMRSFQTLALCSGAAVAILLI